MLKLILWLVVIGLAIFTIWFLFFRTQISEIPEINEPYEPQQYPQIETEQQELPQNTSPLEGHEMKG